MRSSLRLLFLLAIVAVTAGCSTTGYESDFSCPQSYNGRCISLPAAHNLALSGHDDPKYDPSVQQSKKNNSEKELNIAPLTGEEQAHVTYKESLFKRFDSLLKEPATPVVAPPQVMRVLLLPYKGDSNELYMLRHVYFFVEEPRWVLGDSLIGIEED